MRNKELDGETKIDVIIFGILAMGVFVIETHLIFYFGYYFATGKTLEDMLEFTKSHSIYIILSSLVTILLTINHFRSYIDGKIKESTGE